MKREMFNVYALLLKFKEENSKTEILHGNREFQEHSSEHWRNHGCRAAHYALNKRLLKDNKDSERG